jgi:hypothetical protein
MIAQRLLANWKDHLGRFGSVEEAIDAAAITGVAPTEDTNAFTRTQIHIAGGMVAVQLDVDPAEGVDRLRAYAYACGRRISSVAADIVARRLTLQA